MCFAEVFNFECGFLLSAVIYMTVVHNNGRFSVVLVVLHQEARIQRSRLIWS